MIDITTETLVTLSEAARLRPAGRGGRPTHTSTVFRWSSRGIRLEVIRLGSVTYTSHQALQRFADRFTADADGPLRSDVNSTRHGPDKSVEEKLARIGI